MKSVWRLMLSDRLVHIDDGEDIDTVYFTYLGLRNTKITESPRKNIFEMKRSLFTGLAFFLPFPVLGVCFIKKGKAKQM